MHTYQDNGAVPTPPASQSSPRSATDDQQNRLMRIALGLLFVALVVVTVKDWGFWSDFLFPEEHVADTSSAPITTASTVPAQTVSPAAPATEHHARTKHRAVESSPREAVVAPVIMTSSRTVLPPLQIDVVAGNRHQTVQAGKRSVQVDMQDATVPVGPTATAQGDGVTTSAAGRVVVASNATSVVTHSVTPNYPVLAKQMQVQGAVIMQALIGKNGNIQNLRVLSGPAILSEAAREAVKQWHFKPYLMAGQPVETEARITVNFTISTD